MCDIVAVIFIVAVMLIDFFLSPTSITPSSRINDARGR